MVVNLRKKLYKYRAISHDRRMACVNYEGRSQAPVFTLGEYNELSQDWDVDLNKVQEQRRAALWTPVQEAQYQTLRREVGHLSGVK